jgi:hypothetical protein
MRDHIVLSPDKIHMVALSFLFLQQVKVPTMPSAETPEHYAPALKHEQDGHGLF